MAKATKVPSITVSKSKKHGVAKKHRNKREDNKPTRGQGR